MPAPEKSLKPAQTLGIVAGGGFLPHRLAESCAQQGIDIFIVALEGQTDPGLVEGRRHTWLRLGALGAAIDAFRERGVQDLVLIGSIRKPALAQLRPDMKGARFLARACFFWMRDNDLLSALKNFLEKEGFSVHGIQDYAGGLLAPVGAMGAVAPLPGDQADIRAGIAAARALGRADKGQAVVVRGGKIIGREGPEGTGALIKACAGAGGVLVKICKPQQDLRLDLPSIGPDTVEQAAAAGLRGIAVHAGRSLVLDRERVAQIADQHRIFVTGIDPGPQGKT